MGDWTKDALSTSDFCRGSSGVPPSTTTETNKRKLKKSDFDSDNDDEIELRHCKEAKEEVENLLYPQYKNGRGYLIQKGLQNKCVGGTRSVSSINHSNRFIEHMFNTLKEGSSNRVGSTSSGDNKIINEKPTEDLNERVDYVDNTSSEDKEIINEKPATQEEISPPSKISNKRRKLKKGVKLDLKIVINKKGESAVNFSSETHSKTPKKFSPDENISSNLQSPKHFPSLS